MTPETAKTIYWAKMALGVRDGFGMHHVTGQLDKTPVIRKRDWGNVTEHCLVEVARAEVLGRWVGLPEDVIADMKIAAVLHDVAKKQEIETTRQAEKEGGSPLAAYRANSAETVRLLQKSGFNEQIIRLANAPGGQASELRETKRILDQPVIPDRDLAYLIVHYIDDCSVGSDWIRPSQMDESGKKTNIIDYRAEENKAKPSYRRISEEIGEELKGHPTFDGMNNHDAMALVSHSIEEYLAQIIQQRSGEVIDPLDIPEIVDQRIRLAIAAR